MWFFGGSRQDGSPGGDGGSCTKLDYTTPKKVDEDEVLVEPEVQRVGSSVDLTTIRTGLDG